MGGWIRGGWIWRFGAPRFSVQRSPKPLTNMCFGTPGLKIGAPQKRQIQPRRDPIPHPRRSEVRISYYGNKARSITKTPS